jgi:hypothetical protein
MKIENMKSIPGKREDFERNMNILVEKIRSQQHFFPQGSNHAESLMKVRYLPNRRTNFLTVNETARLQANHMASMMDMDFDQFLNKKEES